MLEWAGVFGGREAVGSIVAGVVLGNVALRNRSFIPGAILQWSVADTLDFFAL